MWTRKELKERAKAILRRNYWPMVLVGVIYTLTQTSGSNNSGVNVNVNVQNPSQVIDLTNQATQSMQDINTSVSDFTNTVLPPLFRIIVGLSPILIIVAIIAAIALTVFILNPIEVGIRRYLLENKKGKATFDMIIFPFSDPHFMNIVKVKVIAQLHIFAWTLLFIIPGIIKSYELYMVSYILADDPGISADEALARSKEMMMGEKGDTFILNLSFFGWAFLSALTGGILSIFFVTPYILLTDTELYDVLVEGVYGDEMYMHSDTVNDQYSYDDAYDNNTHNNDEYVENGDENNEF